MKQVLLFVAVIILIATAQAQVSISPLTAQFSKHASDQVTVTNDGVVPVAVTLDSRTVGVVAGKIAVLPLSKDVTVKLHELSARIEPHSAHTFDYDIRCGRCATMLVATVAPIERKIKAVEDGEVHAGIHVNVAFAEVIYVCEAKVKAKECRASFTDIIAAK